MSFRPFADLISLTPGTVLADAIVIEPIPAENVAGPVTVDCSFSLPELLRIRRALLFLNQDHALVGRIESLLRLAGWTGGTRP